MSKPSSFAASQTSRSLIPLASAVLISFHAQVTCPVCVVGWAVESERRCSRSLFRFLVSGGGTESAWIRKISALGEEGNGTRKSGR